MSASNRPRRREARKPKTLLIGGHELTREQFNRYSELSEGRDHQRAMDQVLAAAGGVAAAPSQFDGLATILSLVARGIGVAMLPRLTLAGGDTRVVVRDLPGESPARDLYAVARSS